MHLQRGVCAIKLNARLKYKEAKNRMYVYR